MGYALVCPSWSGSTHTSTTCSRQQCTPQPAPGLTAHLGTAGSSSLSDNVTCCHITTGSMGSSRVTHSHCSPWALCHIHVTLTECSLTWRPISFRNFRRTSWFPQKQSNGHYRTHFLTSKFTKNAFAPEAPPWTSTGKLTVLPRPGLGGHCLAEIRRR